MPLPFRPYLANWPVHMRATGKARGRALSKSLALLLLVTAYSALHLVHADTKGLGKINDARCAILTGREELQTSLCLRALTDKGRHPSTYGGAKKNWATTPLSDDVWSLADRLVSICDEAAIARPSDVLKSEAQLYGAHVRNVIDSLPDMVNAT